MALIKRDRENFWMLNWLDEYMTGHKGFICGGCFKNMDHSIIMVSGNGQADVTAYSCGVYYMPEE